MRVDENIIINFISLRDSLDDFIKKYRITQIEIARGIDMPLITFTKKLKKKSFSAEEVLRICQYINALP
jgi:hypothetical protein